MKVQLNQSKIVRALKGAGVVFADTNVADAAASAINDLLPEEELFTKKDVDKVKDESKTTEHDLREEAKVLRIQVEEMQKQILNKERSEFPEENRNKLIQKEFDQKVKQLKEAEKKLEEIGDYKTVIAERDKLLEAKNQKVSDKYDDFKAKITEMLKDKDINNRLGNRYKFPEKAEEETIEFKETFISKVEEDIKIGVPGLVEIFEDVSDDDDDEEIEEIVESNNSNPSGKKGKEKSPEEMTEDDFAKEDVSMQEW